MNRLHELFLIALDVFNLATSRGFYFLPFLFAIAYLILSDDEKHKRTITFFWLRLHWECLSCFPHS